MKKWHWIVVLLFVWIPARSLASVFFDRNDQFWPYEITYFLAFVSFAMIAEFILLRTGIIKKL